MYYIDSNFLLGTSCISMSKVVLIGALNSKGDLWPHVIRMSMYWHFVKIFLILNHARWPTYNEGNFTTIGVRLCTRFFFRYEVILFGAAYTFARISLSVIALHDLKSEKKKFLNFFVFLVHQL